MKLKVQIPYKKFGVITISEIEVVPAKLEQALEQAKKLINSHSLVEEQTFQKKSFNNNNTGGGFNYADHYANLDPKTPAMNKAGTNQYTTKDKIGLTNGDLAVFYKAGGEKPWLLSYKEFTDKCGINSNPTTKKVEFEPQDPGVEFTNQNNNNDDLPWDLS